jgi:hypothetical protein
MAFRSLYRTASVSRTGDFDRELETLKWMAIGTKQSFEKTHSITAHVCTPWQVLAKIAVGEQQALIYRKCASPYIPG